jgi:hypothetical protein
VQRDKKSPAEEIPAGDLVRLGVELSYQTLQVGV